MTYSTISESVDAYETMIDDCYPRVNIGLEWRASDVLRTMDPCAFKTGWIEWLDADGIDSDDLEDDYTFEWDRR